MHIIVSSMELSMFEYVFVYEDFVIFKGIKIVITAILISRLNLVS